MFFSVIIPAYNVQDYIRDCLDSILAQPFKDYEVVIVDDGSTDKTCDIAMEYAKAYSNFHVYSIPLKSASAARNYALDKAQGQYAVFVDSDDRIGDKMFARLKECLDNGNADICFLPNFSIESKVGTTGHNLIPSVEDKDYFFKTKEEFSEFVFKCNGVVPGAMWTAVCSRKIIEDHHIRLNESYIWSEDTDFMYSVFEHSSTVAICGYRGYLWNRKNVGSSTHSISADKIINRLTIFNIWYHKIEDGAYGDLPEESRDYLKGIMLRNYCNTLFDYSFMKDGKERKRVRKKYISDDILKEDPSLVPKEYVRYGLVMGRFVFLVKHYAFKILKRQNANDK